MTYQPRDGQWQALVSDLEGRVDALTVALDDVREIVSRLRDRATFEHQPPLLGSTGVGEAARSPAPWGFQTPSLSVPIPSAVEYDYSPYEYSSPVTQPVVEPVADLEISAEQELVVPLAGEDRDDDTKREELQRMVAQMRDELADVEPPALDDSEAEAPPAYEAEPATYAAPDVEVEEDPDAAAEARREEVRRAVEATRAELASSIHLVHPDDGDDHTEVIWRDRDGNVPAPVVEFEEPKAIRIPSSPIEDRLPIIPIIVIDDPEGRVELVRVYDALARLNRTGQAALLNYTPHSVTVQLSVGAGVVPSALEEAVSGAFGRSCRVSWDGMRFSVHMVEGQEYAA